MPPSIPRQVRWKLFAHTPPPAAAFPEERAGRLLRYVFRGLLDVYSHCNLHAHRVAKTTLYTEGSSGFVTSAAASVVTGWNEPVPGWGYLPLKSTGFPRRTAPRTLLRFIATTDPAESLSPSTDFPGSPVIRLPCSADFSTGRGGSLQLLSMTLSPCCPYQPRRSVSPHQSMRRSMLPSPDK
jgi:hypothetical protein